MSTPNRSTAQWALIAVVVVGLAVDAFVHFHVASAFANHKTSVLSQTDIFRADATVAALVGVALLVRPRRWTVALAFLVAGAGTVAVVLYRYVDVGSIGPIPNMYDPYWAPAEKAISAIAEALATVTAAVLFAQLHRAAGRVRGDAAFRHTEPSPAG
jgi:hypothetical protein